MAATIQIPGPTIVRVKLTDAAQTWTDLGYSDNDNLPSVSFTDHLHEVRTVLSGSEPEQIVNTGISAAISLALVRWDEDVLNDILEKQRGYADGKRVTMGMKLIAAGNDRHYIAVQIASTYTGATAKYEFPTCFLTGNSVSDSQWGNRERVLALNIKAIQNLTGATPVDLYTYTP